MRTELPVGPAGSAPSLRPAAPGGPHLLAAGPIAARPVCFPRLEAGADPLRRRAAGGRRRRRRRFEERRLGAALQGGAPGERLGPRAGRRLELADPGEGALEARLGLLCGGMVSGGTGRGAQWSKTGEI